MDAHIRIENYPGLGTRIYVDVFSSLIRDAYEAHLESESFPWDDMGADEATRFLQDNGFKVAVLLK